MVIYTTILQEKSWDILSVIFFKSEFEIQSFSKTMQLHEFISTIDKIKKIIYGELYLKYPHFILIQGL